MSAKHYTWSAVQKLGSQAIGFTGNILIARQLSPDDYGLIAMLAIFINISMNFTESGFADFLIREPKTSEQDYATVFLHNLIFSVLFYVLLFIAAPFIADFYKRVELINITRILGLIIIFKGLTLSEFTRMRKELHFKRIAIIQISASLFGAIIGYLMAVNNFGYWSLVGQTLTLTITTIFLIVIINSWVPRFHFNWQRYKEMRRFGNNMIVSYLINQVGLNLYSVFIGKYNNSMNLGYYNQAEKINKIGFNSVNGVILTTSYSLLSKEQDPVKRKKMYMSLLNHFFFIHISLSLFLVGCAFPIMKVIFGPQWVPAAPILQLILFSYLVQPFVTINSNIIKIQNKPKIYRNITIIRNILLISGLLLTYTYSIEIILLGQIVARFLSALIDILICGKEVEFYPIEQIKIFLKQLIPPLFSLITCSLIVFYFVSINYIWEGVIYSVLFFVFLITSNILIKNSSFFFFLDKIGFRFK